MIHLDSEENVFQLTTYDVRLWRLFLLREYIYTSHVHICKKIYMYGELRNVWDKDTLPPAPPP